MRVSRELIYEIGENHAGDSDHAWWISGQVEQGIEAFIDYLNNERDDFMGRIEIVPTESHENCDCVIEDEKVIDSCGEHS